MVHGFMGICGLPLMGDEDLNSLLEACITAGETFGDPRAEKSETHWFKAKSCFRVIFEGFFILAGTSGDGQQCDTLCN